MMSDGFARLYRAYGGIGRGSLFFSYRWAVFSHEFVSRMIPDSGTIYDLGSGYGIFSLYLAMKSSKRTIEAIDFSERRVASGLRAAKSLGLDNISFVRADVFTVPMRPAQAVILNDFLHHLPSVADQDRLIARACAALVPGGKIIVVDIARRPFLKFALAWLVDHTIYMGDRICYLEHARFVKLLEDNGIRDVAMSPIDAGRPYSNVIYTGCKK